MSCRNEDRFRPITAAFRMSYEEHRLIEEKIVISGLKKREYYTKAALNEKIEIVAGKFKSDRLSLEVKRLREQLEKAKTDDEELKEAIIDCRCFVKSLLEIMEEN